MTSRKIKNERGLAKREARLAREKAAGLAAQKSPNPQGRKIDETRRAIKQALNKSKGGK